MGLLASSDMTTRNKNDRTVGPAIALAILEALRTIDTPEEVLEDEAFAYSLPRRLGLNDVVENQMRRYADLRRRGHTLELSELDSLVALIGRREDARTVFDAAGTQLANDHFSGQSLARRAGRTISPKILKRRMLVRSMERIARALSPGAEIQTEMTPPTLKVGGGVLANSGGAGAGCEMLTAAVRVAAEMYCGADAAVETVSCEGTGGESCVWIVREAQA